MAGKKRIVIDAGHGGSTDPGAVFFGRQEKDDTLRLALAVGKILEQNGIEVIYTRIDDVYDTPYEKAFMANEAEADYFISFHRNASDGFNRPSGVLSLVYEDTGVPAKLARSINKELARTGFADLGVAERPDLIVLRETNMPAVLVEAGFIDNPQDNRRFDEQFDEIAEAAAAGILNGIGTAEEKTPLFSVQTGAYRLRENAEREAERLQSEGFPAYLTAGEGGLFYVHVGAFKELENAVNMEKELRKAGYNTFLTDGI